MLDKTYSAYLNFWNVMATYDKSFSNLVNNYSQNILNNCVGLKIVANPHWKTYYPLSHRNKRDEIITEISCRFYHILSIARGTNTPASRIIFRLAEGVATILKFSCNYFKTPYFKMDFSIWKRRLKLDKPIDHLG